MLTDKHKMKVFIGSFTVAGIAFFLFLYFNFKFIHLYWPHILCLMIFIGAIVFFTMIFRGNFNPVDYYIEKIRRRMEARGYHE